MLLEDSKGRVVCSEIIAVPAEDGACLGLLLGTFVLLPRSLILPLFMILLMLHCLSRLPTVPHSLCYSFFLAQHTGQELPTTETKK